MSRDLANVKSHNAAISETLKLHHKVISEALEKNLDLIFKSLRFQDKQISQNIDMIRSEVEGIKSGYWSRWSDSQVQIESIAEAIRMIYPYEGCKMRIESIRS